MGVWWWGWGDGGGGVLRKRCRRLENEENMTCILTAQLTPVGVAKYPTAELMLIVVLINVLSVYPDSR